MSFVLLYMDLWPSPIIVTTDTKYCLLIVDDFKFLQIYFLHTKNQVEHVFHMFLTMVER